MHTLAPVCPKPRFEAQTWPKIPVFRNNGSEKPGNGSLLGLMYSWEYRGIGCIYHILSRQVTNISSSAISMFLWTRITENWYFEFILGLKRDVWAQTRLIFWRKYTGIGFNYYILSCQVTNTSSLAISRFFWSIITENWYFGHILGPKTGVWVPPVLMLWCKYTEIGFNYYILPH